MSKAGLTIPVALFLILAIGMFAATPHKTTLREQKKSNYLMLAAMQQDVEGNIAESYELYRRAKEVDPNNKEAAYRYGLYSLIIGDSAKVDESFDLIRDYVETYPMQYEENMQYAELCARRADHAEAYRVLKRLHRDFPDFTAPLYALAQTSLQLHNSDSALFFLKEAEIIDGSMPEYIPLIVEAYMENNDTIGLEREAQARVKAYPNEPAYHVLRAIIAHSLGQADSALTYYKRTEQLFPDNWNVKQALISYYEEIGDSVAATSTLFSAMRSEDAEFEDKMETFSHYVYPMLMAGNVSAQADTLLLSLLDQYPYEAELRNIAAQYYAAQDKLPQACDQIEIAVDMEPDNIDFRTRQVQYLTGAAKYAEAIKAYEATPSHDETYPILELIAASAYQGTGDYATGLCVIDSLLTHISKYPSFDELKKTIPGMRFYKEQEQALWADILAERGTLLFMNGKPDEGTESFELALSLSLDSAMIANNYAYFMTIYGGDIDKAEALSKSAIEAEPDNPVYLDTYAYVLFKQGKYSEANEYMEKTFALAEKDEGNISAEYYEHYGDILSALGRTEKALEMWRKALSMNPDRSILKDKIKLKKYIDE